jgi:adenine/guanine phosphoribosyltransferase-like PRPP-binding protein
MNNASNAHVIKFVGHSEGFRLTSPDWNKQGRVYRALLNELHLPDAFAEFEHAIANEKPADLARELHEAITRNLSDIADCSVRIIDVTSCRLGINILDAIVPDLKLVAENVRSAAIVLVPSDYLPAIQASPHIAELAQTLTSDKRAVFFVDQMGNTYTVGECMGLKLPNPVALILQFAAPPTLNEFSKKAIRQSHRWFGHFIMPSGAHVRTHYDCYPGVLQDDWLFRYIVNEAAKIIEELKPDTLVGFGLAELSVMHLACQMGGQMKLAYVMQTPASTAYLDKIPRGSKVLLVSDMILTGNTADTIREEIIKTDSEVVGLMTLLALSNSNPHIDADVPVRPLCTVNRTFYRSPDECPLCRCDYPKTEVRTLADFRHLPESVHPYDFWEAVHETEAFSVAHREHDGKHYTYYVDIDKLCSMYAAPIARQLVHQLRDVFAVARPKIIIYPESNAARKMAEAVARELHVERVVPIPRGYLSTLPITDRFDLPQALTMIRDKQVLVVDDGCNTLKTISAIENLLHRVHATSLGYLVALNRANIELTSRKVDESKGKFQFYYNWPVATYRSAVDCPECSAV